MYNKLQVAFLAGFYPAMFFLSNNWYIFSFWQGLILVAGTALIALIVLGGISYLLDYIIRHLFKKSRFNRNVPKIVTGTPEALLNAILTFFAILLCVCLFRNTLESIDIYRGFLYAVIGLVVVVFTWSAYRRGLGLIHAALIILSSLSILNLLVNVYLGTKLPVEVWSMKHKAVYDKIEFTRKPNVYLIVTEAYPSKKALQAVYDVDNTSFYEAMDTLGLKINHDYFSNYNHTLASLPSLFVMEHHYGLMNLGNLDSLGGRRILEARLYNPVVDIFRANSYKIQYLHEVNGLMPNGAQVDFCIPSPSLLYGLDVFLIEQSIIKKSFFRYRKMCTIADIKKQLEITIQQDDHFFNFIYMKLPGHSPAQNKGSSLAYMIKQLGKFRKNYGQKIGQANQQLIDFVKFITTRDRDAVVVIIGDHGSWGYRFRKDAHGKFIPHCLFVLDRFGVLAGIRAPQELSVLMEDSTIKSHVNLFKYVFAYLSDDKTILETKAPDDSYESKRLLAIKDGKILKKYVRLKRAKKYKF